MREAICRTGFDWIIGASPWLAKEKGASAGFLQGSAGAGESIQMDQSWKSLGNGLSDNLKRTKFFAIKDFK
jgi:hypothetical protein